MTEILKLSDRNGLIFQAIKLIVMNEGSQNMQELQYKLFQAGIMISVTLLKQAVSVMKEKGDLIQPNVQPVQKPIQEESPAGV